MPELPEVEITRLSLVDRIFDAEVMEVRLVKPLRWPLGRTLTDLIGCRVGAITRRGKYLWLALSRVSHQGGDVANEGGLLIHLGMSGSLGFGSSLPHAGPHDHFEMRTTRGVLRLTDPRRFGAVLWGASMHDGLPGRLLAGLGLEPFDEALSGTYVHDRLKSRRVAIKQALLAGDIVVGAGNIYACEALFRAGIDPRLPAGKLSRPRAQKLVDEVQSVLRQSLAMGGSSLKDFKDAHGSQGHFQLNTMVYGRAGEACRVCSTPIRRLVQGQRATFYCPVCQKR
jgi:formamidopyrimidine-DNA glycosylase